MDISRTIPGYNGIGGVRVRNKNVAMIVRGTSKIRIAKTPVIILASNIRLLLTARVDNNAEIFLVLSMYIWVAPIAQKTSTAIVAAGIPSHIENSGGFLGLYWSIREIDMATRTAEKTAAAIKYTR
jgi:hypothetical protein